MKVAILALLLAALVGGGVAVVYFGPDTKFSDEELKAFNFMPYPEPRDVGDFLLTDAAGGDFGPERLRGRWSFMFFGFANCPDICPIAMAVLGEAETVLVEAGDEPFQGILVTVDPERDTPEFLEEWTKYLPENLHAITGTPGAIRRAADDWGVKYARVETTSTAGYTMSHTADLYLLDEDGQLLATYPFGTTSAEIVKDLRELAAA